MCCSRITDTNRVIKISMIQAAGHFPPQGASIKNTGEGGEGHITIIPTSDSAQGQGTWNFNVQTASQFNGTVWQDTASDGDNISYEAYLSKGTYTLLFIWTGGTVHGIIDIYIDGTEVGSQDTYNASTVRNQETLVTGISITNSGLKEIKFQVDGKNVSSSNYNCQLQYIALWRTA